MVPPQRLADALSDHRHVCEVRADWHARGGRRFVEDKGRPRFFNPSQKVGARHRGGRLGSAAFHRPRHAAGRHSGLCAAPALPHNREADIVVESKRHRRVESRSFRR